MIPNNKGQWVDRHAELFSRLLVELAEEVNADLLVVGDVGLDTVAGRLVGSVPANVAPEPT